jgi:AraC family L-rhamnose operon regulatory protein RhaS
VHLCTDKISKLHHHDFFEFVYVLEGAAEHTIDGHTAIIGPGEFFFINLKSSHAYRCLDDERGFKIINCLFLPSFIDRTLEGARSFREILDNYLVNFGHKKATDEVTERTYRDSDGFIRAAAQKMLDEYRERRTGYKDVLRNLLVTLLVFLARQDTAADEVNSTRYIKEFVVESYARELTLSEIAGEIGISLTYASVKFKEDTGMTFREYLIRYRMERACDLLKRGDKTVFEIAGLVGYSDAAFFYRTFKSRLGVTPRRYREMQRELSDTESISR